ncbi:MAG: hypothetical protein V4576_01585 [Patescibacteria group bacterium]
MSPITLPKETRVICTASCELLILNKCVTSLKEIANRIRHEFADRLKVAEQQPPATINEAHRARESHNLSTWRMMETKGLLDLQRSILTDALIRFVNRNFPDCKLAEGEMFTIQLGQVCIVKIPPVEVVHLKD